MKIGFSAWLGASVIAAFVAGACGGGDASVSEGNTPFGGSGGQAGAAQAGSGGAGQNTSGGSQSSGGNSFIDAGSETIEGLIIEPGPLTVEVVNGVSSSTQFVARAQLQGGGSKEVPATWSVDRLDVASITAAGGLVQPRGNKGGVVTVTAQISTEDGGSFSASTELTVRLRLEENTAGLSPGEIDSFNTPDAGATDSIIYPYDKTVFARGILPPELMWGGGQAGDQYRVAIRSEFVELAAYVAIDPPSTWLMPKAWWDQLAESSDGSPVSVEVQRRTPEGAVYAAAEQSWLIAPGSLRGTIYYWEVSRGQVVKLNPGSDSPVPAFDPGLASELGTPAPPNYAGENPPWDANGAGQRCVACHTVSRDGNRLAALFSACGTSSAGCDRPWGIVDTATEQIEVMSTYTPGPAIFSALTPNGSHLVYDTVSFGMHLADASTTAGMPSMLDALGTTTNVAHPQFSPDGKYLALATNVVGNYPIEFTQSDLEILDAHIGSGEHFSNRRLLVQGGGEAVAFPSFAPDSKWVVYQRGDQVRASFGAAPPFSTGYNDLYLVPTDGSGAEVRLGRANGVGTLPPKESLRNYQPRVNPVSVGGYYWVVFTSARDYGHRMASASDATNENRKQLWVAAIDSNLTPGEDPSHPAFRLTGQDLGAANMDAYWALEPCKQQGSSCSEGYECCTGFCREQPDGGFACVPPPVDECSRIGETCEVKADCCDPQAECVGGLCATPGPK